MALGSSKLFEVILQLTVCVKQARTDGSFGGPEYLCDFRMGHALYVEHRNHSSVIRRQLLEGLVQSFLEFIEIGFPHRVTRRGRFDEVRIILNVRIYIIQAHLLATAALFDEIDGPIDRDRVQPSRETGVSAKSVDRSVGFREDFLQKVVRVFVIGGHIVDQSVNPRRVADHEIVKCRRVSLASAGD